MIVSSFGAARAFGTLDITSALMAARDNGTLLAGGQTFAPGAIVPTTITQVVGGSDADYDSDGNLMYPGTGGSGPGGITPPSFLANVDWKQMAMYGAGIAVIGVAIYMAQKQVRKGRAPAPAMAGYSRSRRGKR